MPKQTKTFQSFSSPPNISWTLQTFLWNHRQQSLLQGLPWRKEVSSLSSFCHIHPCPLKPKVSLACAHQSQKPVWNMTHSSVSRATIKTQTCIDLSQHFHGILFSFLCQCLSASNRGVLQEGEVTLSFLSFSLSVQFSVISNGNKLLLCCINAEMRLLAWLRSSGIGSGIRPGVGTNTCISIGSGIGISSIVGIDWNNLPKRI